MKSSQLRTPSIPPADGRDHLTGLPAELLHLIVSYLYPTHLADKAFHPHDDAGETIPCRKCARRTGGNSHDLDYLAATCSLLRSEVNHWARSWLMQHSSITKFNDGRVWPKPTTKRNGVVQMRKNFTTNFLRGRNGALLTWADHHCVFCGRKSRRTAILMNGFRCCVHCDKREWPDKITMSQAAEQYGIQKHYLQPDRSASSTCCAERVAQPPAFPLIWYGTYIAYNVQTTMFMTTDVKRLAEFIYGDLDAHLAKRKEHREQLKKNREEGKKKKKKKKAKKAAQQRQEMEAEGEAVMRDAQMNASLAALQRMQHTMTIAAQGRPSH